MLPRYFPLLPLLFLIVPSIFGTIRNYTALTGWGVSPDGADTVIVIRKFMQGTDTAFLAVDPDSCSTAVYNSDSRNFSPASWPEINARFAATPYVTALRRSGADADSLQDAGFRRFHCAKNRIELTIDLCPSRKPLDRIVFSDLIAEIGPAERPVPVAISVTGRWMNTHQNDMQWLTSLADSNKLSILWINHTYNHFTKKGLPLNANFMLEKGVDINSEVMRTEITLLQRGLLPSIFFRFPGLVSNRPIFDKIVGFGLVTVGTDAWLAKGEWPKSGSIVLIHANGNEPLGVRDFISLLKKERSEAIGKKWKLFDLRKSVVESVNDRN